VRDLADAAPGFDRFINQAEVFLVLVGLTALLIGGLGVAGAVRAWLASRIDIIATLKCVGAPARLIFRIYLLQVMCIAGFGVSAGVVVAAIAPLFAIQILAGYVTVPLDLTIYPVPLLVAAGFGLGTAYLFAVWPLAKAEEVRAADLFRRLVAIPEGRPKPAYLLSMLAAAGGLALLALIATRDIRITSGFIGGSLADFVVIINFRPCSGDAVAAHAAAGICTSQAGNFQYYPPRLSGAFGDHRLWPWLVSAGHGIAERGQSGAANRLAAGR
jgi:putative ABC transport system permease protein